MSSDAPPPLVGGRYQLRESLGASGAATVFRALDTETQKDCAVQLIDTAHASPDDFARDVRALTRIDHPYILPTLDAGVEGGKAFAVRDHMPGGHLDSYLSRNGPLSPRKAAAVTRGLLGALDAAHYMGVIHGDVRPANIYVGADSKPKIAGFGLARLLPPEARTDWPFVAPEVRADASTADARSDVYSAGATLYSLVTAKTPEDLSSAQIDLGVLAGFPVGLARVIQKATRLDRADRYQRAGEMLADLKAIAAELPQAPLGSKATAAPPAAPVIVAAVREPTPGMTATIVPADQDLENITGEVNVVEDVTDPPSDSQVLAMPRRSERLTTMPPPRPERDVVGEPAEGDDEETPTQLFDRDVIRMALGEDEAGEPVVSIGTPLAGIDPGQERAPVVSIPAGGADRDTQEKHASAFVPESKGSSLPVGALVAAALALATLIGAAIYLTSDEAPPTTEVAAEPPPPPARGEFEAKPVEPPVVEPPPVVPEPPPAVVAERQPEPAPATGSSGTNTRKPTRKSTGSSSQPSEPANPVIAAGSAGTATEAGGDEINPRIQPSEPAPSEPAPAEPAPSEPSGPEAAPSEPAAAGSAAEEAAQEPVIVGSEPAPEAPSETPPADGGLIELPASDPPASEPAAETTPSEPPPPPPAEPTPTPTDESATTPP